MTERRSAEFRKRIVEECFEVGNVSLVCRRHGLSPGTVYRWVRKQKTTGSPESLPRETQEKMSEMSSRVKHLSGENAILKKVVAEKEVEIAILRELLEKVNPK